MLPPPTVDLQESANPAKAIPPWRLNSQNSATLALQQFQASATAGSAPQQPQPQMTVNAQQASQASQVQLTAQEASCSVLAAIGPPAGQGQALPNTMTLPASSSTAVDASQPSQQQQQQGEPVAQQQAQPEPQLQSRPRPQMRKDAVVEQPQKPLEVIDDEDDNMVVEEPASSQSVQLPQQRALPSRPAFTARGATPDRRQADSALQTPTPPEADSPAQRRTPPWRQKSNGDAGRSASPDDTQGSRFAEPTAGLDFAPVAASPPAPAKADGSSAAPAERRLPSASAGQAALQEATSSGANAASGGGEQDGKRASSNPAEEPREPNGGRAWRAANSRGPSSRQGGKGKEGKGAKGKKGSKNLVQLSRALSLILRHKAQDMGVRIRPDGFCPLDVVLDLNQLRDLQATREDVEAVVNTNEKKRFELESIDGQTMIRAVQGHSMKVVNDEELLERLEAGGPDVPDKVVHGTYRRHYDSIMDKGLVAGGVAEGPRQRANYGRNHIHFVSYTKWSGNREIISGMRGDCDVVIVVDLEDAMKAGIPFYRSKNDVILSPGSNGVLATRFFAEAKCVRTGISLWTRQ